MAARVHFDLENSDGFIRDELGVDVQDVGLAVADAIEEIERMRASGELGDALIDWSLIVRDVEGITVKRIRI
jgi:hypothetical protein